MSNNDYKAYTISSDNILGLHHEFEGISIEYTIGSTSSRPFNFTILGKNGEPMDPSSQEYTELCSIAVKNNIENGILSPYDPSKAIELWAHTTINQAIKHDVLTGKADELQTLYNISAEHFPDIYKTNVPSFFLKKSPDASISSALKFSNSEENSSKDDMFNSFSDAVNKYKKDRENDFQKGLEKAQDIINSPANNGKDKYSIPLNISGLEGYSVEYKFVYDSYSQSGKGKLDTEAKILDKKGNEIKPGSLEWSTLYATAMKDMNKKGLIAGDVNETVSEWLNLKVNEDINMSVATKKADKIQSLYSIAQTYFPDTSKINSFTRTYSSEFITPGLKFATQYPIADGIVNGFKQAVEHYKEDQNRNYDRGMERFDRLQTSTNLKDAKASVRNSPLASLHNNKFDQHFADRDKEEHKNSSKDKQNTSVSYIRPEQNTL